MILIVFGITLIIASKQEELKGWTKEKNSLFNPRRHKICFREHWRQYQAKKSKLPIENKKSGILFFKQLKRFFINILNIQLRILILGQ